MTEGTEDTRKRSMSAMLRAPSIDTDSNATTRALKSATITYLDLVSTFVLAPESLVFP
jgi:hypothetical protein